MKKIAITAALLAAAAVSAPAHAGNAEGKWQVKVLATGVLPDGKIDTGSAIVNAGVLNGTNDTKANDNVVPTLAVEYFASPNFSIETICCFTSHHVSVTGTPSLSNAMDHVLILPATVTLKAHLPAGPFKPYIGAGVAHFFVFGEKPGSSLPAAVTSAKLDNTFGAVLQGGVDIAVNDTGMGISLDAKKYFIIRVRTSMPAPPKC
ncbi:MAG: OmpW/AlkL family protein [Novosphingobium sp.]